MTCRKMIPIDKWKFLLMNLGQANINYLILSIKKTTSKVIIAINVQPNRDCL